MLVLDLKLSAEQVLEECGWRGLVVRSEGCDGHKGALCREARARAQFGDPEIERPDPAIKRPLAMAVAPAQGPSALHKRDSELDLDGPEDEGRIEAAEAE